MTNTSYSGGDTLTAFFDSRAEAETAVDRLRAADIPERSIRLSGADGGAATRHEEKGFLESISDFFFPEEDRHTYEEGIRRGGYLVTVTETSPTLRSVALDILEDSGAVDLDERERTWREEGWTGYSGTGAQAGFAEGQGSFTGREGAGGETVPVVEEELRVGKRDRSHGRVRVRSYVREEPASAEVDLRDERVEVERRPVDRAVGAGEGAFQERSVEAEEHSEEAVVGKEARVVEEVGLRKKSDSHRETVSDTVRRTDVEVEREDDADRR